MTDDDSITRTVGWLLVGLFTTLAISGIGLSFEYRPHSHYFAPPRHLMMLPDALRLVHNLATLAFIPLLIAYLILVVRRRARPSAITGSAIAALATVGAVVSGVVLAWDQLALWAVSTHLPDFRGVWRAAFDHDHIRFLIVGGREISQGLYRNYLLTHVFVVPALLVVSALALRRAKQRGSVRAEDAGAGVGGQG